MENKVIKGIFIIITFITSFQCFAISSAGMSLFSPSLAKLELRSNNKKEKNKQSVTEPSKLFIPQFYSKDELKDVFNAYELVRDKIENPGELKSINLVKNMEVSVSPHLKSPSSNVNSLSDIVFFVEFKAIFL